jgi:Tfp pilus assembly major pilin PilA
MTIKPQLGEKYMKKTTKTTSLVGRQLTITPGTRVTTTGQTVTRKQKSTVTVRAIETTRNGKTRIVWKSMGYRATAVI